MKKLIISSIVALLSLSCSFSTPNNSTQEASSSLSGSMPHRDFRWSQYATTGQPTSFTSPFSLHSSLVQDTSSHSLLTAHYSLNFSDLEKEYKSFYTKSLSDGYVSRMFNKFLVITPNPTQVIRQLEFARYLKDVKSDMSYFNSIKTFIGGDIAKFNLINNTNGVTQKKTTEPTTFGAFVDGLNPNPSTSIVTSGLVLNLDAGNPASYPGTGTTWTDLSGNGNSGTLINGVGYDSANSGSLVFDGSSDYVNCGNNSVLNTTDITVSVWLYQPLPNSTNLILSRYGQGNGVELIYANSTNKFYFSGRESSATYLSCPTTNTFTNLNKWYNLTGTKSGNVWRIYVDGILENTVTLGSGNVAFLGNTLLIGSEAGGWYAKANIGSTLIYNRALSQSELTQNFNSLKGRYGL